MPPKKYYKRPTNPIHNHNKITSNAAKKYLVIVESPSKCHKIEEYLGHDYQCIASCGHFRAIAGLSSIDVKNDYAITFTIDPTKQDIVDKMRHTISLYSPEHIYLASDDDREGEAIAWHICDTFGLDIELTHRIIFHEITKPAILAAIQSPRTVNMCLVHAQFARQVLDMLVGFRISPVLWRHIFSNKKNALSAGRCQTPALRLVLDNELKREQEAESSVFYRAKGEFTDRNIEFVLDHEFQTKEETLAFFESTKTFRHILTIGKTTDSIRQPPKPFSTSRLLQTSRWSPKQTMDMAQQLYQQGLITYMRTDAETYSPVFLQQVKTFITQKYTDPKYLGVLVNSISQQENATNQEHLGETPIDTPHEAIRCTNVNMSYITTENASVNALYRLIWQNTVESCMSAAEYKVSKVHISSVLEDGNKAKWNTSVEIPINLGWKVVSLKEPETPTDLANIASSLLHYLNMLNGKQVGWSEIKTSAHMRDRIGHFTESSLIKKLEDLGIGRPSTFASIVETLKDRGYVAKQDVPGKEINCAEYCLTSDGKLTLLANKRIFGNESNKLVLQPLGRLAAEFLTDHFANSEQVFDKRPTRGGGGMVFDYSYTSLMEEALDKISSGEIQDWPSVCRTCSNDLRALLKDLEGVEKKVFKLKDDSGYEFVFTSAGQTLRKRTDDSWEYESVRKDIVVDLGKLERKEYTFQDLVEIPNEVLGEYLGEPVLLKSGKFGLYIEHGENTVSLKSLDINKPAREITLSDVVSLLSPLGIQHSGENTTNTTNATNPNILREITPDLSVRKGKYGLYIFYKTNSMKTPKFFPTKGFKQNVMTCDLVLLEAWIRETYM